MQRVIQYLLAAGALLLSNAVFALEQRIIFDNPGYVVTTDDTGRYCEQPMHVTIESDNPAIFERRATLQRIVDGAQAVLAYECPKLEALRVSGILAGISDPVYLGLSERNSDWRLDTRRSFETREYREDAGYDDPWSEESSSVPEPEPDSSDKGAAGSIPQFNVANLQAGMTVEEARAAIQDTFGVQPVYDPEEGVLDMQARGCPENYDWSALSPAPRAGWKCMRAWFTDQRVERLYLLELMQVVESDQAESVESLLVEQFGEPTLRRTQKKEPEWWADDRATRTRHVLAWGEVVETVSASNRAGQADRYALQARITPLENVTVLGVTLYRPDIRPGRSASREPATLDLNL